MREQHPHRSSVAGTSRDIGRTLGAYVRGQLLVMAAMMGIYAIGFEWADVPLSLLAAVICGFFHLVPMLGWLLAVFVPVTFVVIGGGELVQLLQVVAVFLAAQLIETFYLTPRILGRELSLSPLVVLASILVGGLTLGPLGALLAPPIAAVALLVWRAVRSEPPARGS